MKLKPFEQRTILAVFESLYAILQEEISAGIEIADPIEQMQHALNTLRGRWQAAKPGLIQEEIDKNSKH